MRRFVLAMAAIALLLALPRVAEANITYSIQNYSADQGGLTLTGSITTDGTIGDLATSDILSWTYTITAAGGSTGTASSTDSGAGITLLENVVASQSSITLAFPDADATEVVNQLRLDTPPGAGSANLDYVRELYAPGSNTTDPHNFYIGSAHNVGNWNNMDPAMGGTNPWVIATAVPEPSSLILAGPGALGLIGCRLARRHMAVRSA
jgi:hypothetical protein